MIKARENFTYYLDSRPIQMYSGQLVSLPEGDEAYLIETGKAEDAGDIGGSGSVECINCALAESNTEEYAEYTLTNATALCDSLDDLSINPEKSFTKSLILRLITSDGGQGPVFACMLVFSVDPGQVYIAFNWDEGRFNVIASRYVSEENPENIKYYIYLDAVDLSFSRNDIDENDVATLRLDAN